MIAAFVLAAGVTTAPIGILDGQPVVTIKRCFVIQSAWDKGLRCGPFLSACRKVRGGVECHAPEKTPKPVS